MRNTPRVALIIILWCFSKSILALPIEEDDGDFKSIYKKDILSLPECFQNRCFGPEICRNVPEKAKVYCYFCVVPDFSSCVKRVIDVSVVEPEVKIRDSTENRANSVANDINQFDEEESQFTDANFQKSINEFSQSILTKVWDENSNLVFSPFSIHVALTILASGTTKNSETRRELMTLLIGEGMKNKTELEDLELKYHNLLKNYDSDEIRRILNHANLFATVPHFFGDILPSFTGKLGNLYGSKFYVLTENPDPVKVINEFVNENTNGHIKSIVGENQLPPDLVFVIVNALHFKASWTDLFLKAGEDSPVKFKLSDGKVSSNARMMFRHTNDFKFTDLQLASSNLSVKVLSIPYDFVEKDRFEMVIVMPQGENGLERLQNEIGVSANTITGNSVNGTGREAAVNIFDLAFDAIDNEKQKEAEIFLPMFDIETSLSLGSVLQSLNVNAPFDQGGFDEIVPDSNFVLSQMKHKAKIEVNEEGTEASAATAAFLVTKSAIVIETVDIDRPFLFIVRDRLQRIPLFVGKVTDPK